MRNCGACFSTRPHLGSVRACSAGRRRWRSQSAIRKSGEARMQQWWDLRDAAGREIAPGRAQTPWLAAGAGSGGASAGCRGTPSGQPGNASRGRPAAARPPLHAGPGRTDLRCGRPRHTGSQPGRERGTAEAGRPRSRRRRFAEEVLRAYAYQCAMCGFDGALGHYPVGIQAAHVRWHSQEGPDEIPNALALCALHHALFDLGVAGITEDRRICVSNLYVARNEAGRAVDALAGQPLLIPLPRQPTVDVMYITWHHQQVFEGAMPHAESTTWFRSPEPTAVVRDRRPHPRSQRCRCSPVLTAPGRRAGSLTAPGRSEGGWRPSGRGRASPWPLVPVQARQGPAGQQPAEGRSRRDAKRCWGAGGLAVSSRPPPALTPVTCGQFS